MCEREVFVTYKEVRKCNGKKEIPYFPAEQPNLKCSIPEPGGPRNPENFTLEDVKISGLKGRWERRSALEGATGSGK